MFWAEFLELCRIGGLVALVSLGLRAWDIDMDVAVRVLWTERLEFQLYSDQGPKAWGFLRLFQTPTGAISRLHTQKKTSGKILGEILAANPIDKNNGGLLPASASIGAAWLVCFVTGPAPK